MPSEYHLQPGNYGKYWLFNTARHAIIRPQDSHEGNSMKTQAYTYLFSAIILSLSLTAVSAHAQDSATLSVEELSTRASKPQYRAETIYQPDFFPGVRLCQPEEVDYRGDLRKINCQDEKLINAVSTREQDPYNLRPRTIIDNRIEPNGNLLRIKFQRKSHAKPASSENQ